MVLVAAVAAVAAVAMEVVEGLSLVAAVPVALLVAAGRGAQAVAVASSPEAGAREATVVLVALVAPEVRAAVAVPGVAVGSSAVVAPGARAVLGVPGVARNESSTVIINGGTMPP